MTTAISIEAKNNNSSVPSLLFDLERANARQKESTLSLQTEYIIRELEKLKTENQELRSMIIKQSIQRHDSPYKAPKSKRPEIVSPLLLSNFTTVDNKDQRPPHVTFSTLGTNPSPGRESQPKSLVPKILRENKSQLLLSDLKLNDVSLSEHVRLCSECTNS